MTRPEVAVQIPDHLIDVVRELAEANLERAIGDVRVIEGSPGTNGEHASLARARLAQARELCAHVGCQARAVA